MMVVRAEGSRKSGAIGIIMAAKESCEGKEIEILPSSISLVDGESDWRWG